MHFEVAIGCRNKHYTLVNPRDYYCVMSVFTKLQKIVFLFEVCLPFEPSKHLKASFQPYTYAIASYIARY